VNTLDEVDMAALAEGRLASLPRPSSA